MPMVRKMTSMTNTRPERILFSRSATISRISWALSMTLVILVPLGQLGESSPMIVSISSLMVMMFSPLRFFTERFTAERPSSRERLVSSLKPSTTWATFLRYTGSPPWVPMIRP